MTPTPARRVMVVALLFVAVVGAIVADRAVDSAPVQVTSLPGAEGPEATSSSALSSSWYCPGGTSNGGPLDSSIAVLNPTDAALSGTVTVMPNEGKQATRAFDVAPSSSFNLVVRDVLEAKWAAVLVELDGGGAVVEQRVGNSSDYGTSPCSPSASSTWYFPSGSTQKDGTLWLSLFNPFPDDAIIDLAFATGEGRRVPADFEGIVVPALSVVPVDIGAHVRRQDFVSTEVRARSGRVIAGQSQVRTAPAGTTGVSLVLGAPALGETWLFPEGLVGPGVAERLELYNPSEQEARVDVELALEEGEVEPFEITVPAQGRMTLDLGAEERVPKGVPHAALVQSINGVPVAVARVVESSAPRVGRTDTLGARRLSQSWGLAFGEASETTDMWVIVYNPTEEAAVVDVVGLADGQRVAIEGLQGVPIPAGRRMGLRLTHHIKRAPLPVVVSANVGVVVERALYASPGVDLTMAIPLG
jgi:hypothetical protein